MMGRNVTALVTAYTVLHTDSLIVTLAAGATSLLLVGHMLRDLLQPRC